MAAGFSPLFPVWIAVFAQLFGASQVFWVAPFFGLCAVAAIFFVGHAVSGNRAGFLAGLLLLASMPQIWFSRFPMGEVLAQFLLFASLWILIL